MELLKVLILVCASQVGRADCTPETATSVVVGPEASNQAVCGFQAQSFLAGMAMAENLEGQYVKILCYRPGSATEEARR